MKSYYFISGLPRSGSTLLSSILSQNPDFYADISSPLEPLTESTIDIISFSRNNFTIEENQRKNIMHGIFDGYYHHVEKSVIFDTSRKWTKRTNFIKYLFPYTKILCPVRDIVSILNSFELIFSKNPFHTNILVKNNHTVFDRCDEIASPIDGILGVPLVYLQEGFSLNPEMIYFIEYDELCKNPEKIMKNIYNFLEKPYYNHDFENLYYSNKIYDKSCNIIDLHTVKRRVEHKKTKNVLPESIITKYQNLNMEFWRNNNFLY